MAFFKRRVGDREIAFDLTAETFAAVVVSAGAYGGDAPPVAWLFGIARNKLRESLRRDRVADAARRRLGMEPIALDDEALARVEERAGSGESVRMMDHSSRESSSGPMASTVGIVARELATTTATTVASKAIDT